MAIPLYDALNVQHSKNIGDPVAAATTNGDRWTSAQRDFHLNEAIRSWIRRMTFAGARLERNGQDAGVYWDALQGYITSEAQALSSNTKTIASWNSGAGVVYILSAYDTTLSKPMKRVSERNYTWAQTGGNGFLTASSSNILWTQDGSSIRVSGSGATDSITLRYVKAHTALAANTGSSDILVPPPYWDEILNLAFSVAKMELGDVESVTLAMAKEASVDKEIFGA